MFETLIAGFVLLLCAVMLLRLVIGARRRQRLDGLLLRHWLRLRRTVMALRYQRHARKEAAKVAEEAIRRAREGGPREGRWDGNVYRPDSFRDRRKDH